MQTSSSPLSSASLRELLLSCALDNEHIATHINNKLYSHNGINTQPSNLENFGFHSSGVSGEHFISPAISTSSTTTTPTPRSPDLVSDLEACGIKPKPVLAGPEPNGYNGVKVINASVEARLDNNNNGHCNGNGNSNGHCNGNGNGGGYTITPSMAPLASWNWSYHYYKESSCGATTKRDDVDEAAAQVKSRAYYWNDEFQAISEKIRDVDMYDEEQVYVSMANLYQDFEHVVETYGKIIIAERFLPFSEKSIPPAFYMGGVAGGEKYIVQGILFKFSVDKNNLYDGDHNAAKAAGHDLKSLIQVYKSRTKGLHVPMMCLVDYLGYRVIAMSMLPVDISTLCYGSCDGGNDVRSDITEFNELMLQLGRDLNLKSHAVGVSGKEIVGPCDIEGHTGRDDKFYLLDFARLFPPEAPLLVTNRKNAHLYRLLRPELVRSFSVPLSSDAFTLFGKRGAGVHNKEVRQATEHLLNDKIPHFASVLDFQESPSSEKWPKHRFRYELKIAEDKLAEILHREGINLRHLGRVRAKVKSQRWRDALLREIIARVIKNTIRDKLRSQMEQLKHPGIVLYRQTIVDYLNLVFGNSSTSTVYWSMDLVVRIEYFYEEALNHEKAERFFDLKQGVDLLALFSCVRRLTGMTFSPHCGSGDATFFAAQYPFQETDLLSFPPKIKQMRIAAYASATALYLKAKYNTDKTESDRLAALASVQFEAALKSNPDDDMILCSYALLLRFQKRYDEARAYYKMAIRSNPTSARILSHYAWFLYRDLQRYDKVDKYYLKALEQDSKHSRTLADYACFLHHARKDDVKAEEYYLKGVALGDKQAISGYARFLAKTGRGDEAKHYGERVKSASGKLIFTSESG